MKGPRTRQDLRVRAQHFRPQKRRKRELVLRAAKRLSMTARLAARVARSRATLGTCRATCPSGDDAGRWAIVPLTNVDGLRVIVEDEPDRTLWVERGRSARWAEGLHALVRVDGEEPRQIAWTDDDAEALVMLSAWARFLVRRSAEAPDGQPVVHDDGLRVVQ
jgi:hypothetical protein